MSRPYSSILRLIPAYSSQGLRKTRTLAGVGWNELEGGGVEHKMSTVAMFFVLFCRVGPGSFGPGRKLTHRLSNGIAMVQDLMTVYVRLILGLFAHTSA